MEKRLKTNFLVSDFSAVQLPESPTYEVACAICDETSFCQWETLIRRLLLAHQLDFMPIKRMETGENPVFLLRAIDGKQAYIKFIAPNWRFQFDHERAAVESCNKVDLNVSVPELICAGDYQSWGYLITSHVEGELLSELLTNISIDEQCAIAQQLGQFSRDLHQLEIEPDSVLHCDWPKFIEKQLSTSYDKRAKQKLRQDYLNDFQPYLSNLNYGANGTGKSVLLHTDLHPGNVLVKKNSSGQYILSGVIDFGDAMIGQDIHFEFTSVALLFALGNREILAAFLKGYGYVLDNERAFIDACMALTLIRHTGDLNYIINTVPKVANCNSWKEAEQHLFPL